MKNVALWGPTSSGKTVLLAQLYLRFPSSGKWKIFPTAETQEYVERMRRILVEERSFPLGTREEDAHRISYEFEHRESHQRVGLFTEDRAGVLSERLDEKDFEYFTAAGGVVMLIDAVRPNYQGEVLKAIERFYHAGKDERPTAFCLAKADLYIHTPAELRRAQEQGEAFVLERLPEEFTRRLADFCPTLRFFPVSSVGVQTRFGLVQPTVYYDQRMFFRMKEEIAPIHLAAPFEWLFDQLAGDD